ncbi:hypothetical protein BLOT_006027 [Blomia tropicalis]|nr:hypothetical protein BLOT_006027 [Blomia tropicalis]
MQLMPCKLNVHLLIALFILLSGNIANIESLNTLCNVITDGHNYPIQGAVFFPHDSSGLLFVRERVFTFKPLSDFNQETHTLTISTQGIPIEKYFQNIFLKDDSKIFNVYGTFTNYSGSLFFVLSNEKANDPTFKGSGFMYDLEKRRSIETDGSMVTPHFPWIYFSDNKQMVYLYQLPTYTFYAQNNFSGLDSTSYFTFNSFDREMNFVEVTGLRGLDQEKQMMKILHDKMILRSGFTYGKFIYLITSQNVYIVSIKEMQTNPWPKFKKLSLSNFIKCTSTAEFTPTDWNKVITNILIVTLFIIIATLLWSIIFPSRSVIKSSRKSSSKTSIQNRKKSSLNSVNSPGSSTSKTTTTN